MPKNAHHKFPSLKVLVLSRSRIQNLRSRNHRKQMTCWFIFTGHEEDESTNGFRTKPKTVLSCRPWHNIITKHTNQESSWQFSISEKCLKLCVSHFPFTFFNHLEPLSSGLHLKKQSTLFFFDYINFSNTIYFAVKTSQSCFVCVFPSSKASWLTCISSFINLLMKPILALQLIR